MRKAVRMRFSPRIRHGVDGKRHIETRFVRLASRGFYARTGGHARENNLRHTFCLQLGFQVGIRKGAPSAFGDEYVVRLLMQFGNQFTEVGGKLPMPSMLLCPSRRGPGDINQSHEQLLLAKGLDKLTRMVDDTSYGMKRRYVPKALLKIHHDQRSLRVKYGEWHKILL